MSATESVLTATCHGDRLVGVLHRPATPRGTGVLVIVGGPQYRAGSHRQFVQLARALAQRGHAVLRFDARGMGDSDGTPRVFTALGDDIQAALDAFTAALPTLRGVVLWGLCDGASAALLHQLQRDDPRVLGLCLLNPWLRSEATLARAHVKHYYLQRLAEGVFWRKLLSGQVAASALRELFANVGRARRAGSSAPEDFRAAMARAWKAFRGPILLVLSGRDLTAKEFVEALPMEPAWAGALTRPRLTRLDLAEADHTFSTRAERECLQAAVADWLEANFAADGSPR
jgi:exosortase A-associated hydrolase 1